MDASKGTFSAHNDVINKLLENIDVPVSIIHENDISDVEICSN